LAAAQHKIKLHVFVELSGLIASEKNTGSTDILSGSEMPVIFSKGPVADLNSDGKAFGLSIFAGCRVFSLAMRRRDGFWRTEGAVRVVSRRVFQGRSEPKGCLWGQCERSMNIRQWPEGVGWCHRFCGTGEPACASQAGAWQLPSAVPAQRPVQLFGSLLSTSIIAIQFLDEQSARG
jgi:hypothetical protein